MTANVLIVGGTHGNEISGIALVQQWCSVGTPIDFPGLTIDYLLANSHAIEHNRRFIEADLNRQFSLAALSQPSSTIEGQLAQSLNQRYGPKGQSQTAVVIDIHNTTSAMGATLILPSEDPWYIQLGRYVKQHMPHANILLENDNSYEAHPYLCTLGQYGVMIEVGAQPQGVLRADIYQLTQEMLIQCLRYCQLAFVNQLPTLPPCDAFALEENLVLPLSAEGSPTAMIHPALQDKDFCELKPGDPVFLGFDGQVHRWWENSSTYPHFINEAAYRRQHVAFAKARKIIL